MRPDAFRGHIAQVRKIPREETFSNKKQMDPESIARRAMWLFDAAGLESIERRRPMILAGMMERNALIAENYNWRFEGATPGQDASTPSARDIIGALVLDDQPRRNAILMVLFRAGPWIPWRRYVGPPDAATESLRVGCLMRPCMVPKNHSCRRSSENPIAVRCRGIPRTGILAENPIRGRRESYGPGICDRERVL